ncbi:MAG: sulfatase family protein [Planctomycetota bacterium]|jgi:arylsulfatase A-like enzyme
MKRFRFLSLVMVLTVAVLGVVFLLYAKIWPKNAADKPNILIISLCSIRPDHMSCYGYQRRTTPNFDDLAAESFVFENAITQWPKTTPAFAAMMTGKYCHTTGVMRTPIGQRLGDEHETLAEILWEHGYDTAAFISSAALHKKTNLFQGCGVVGELWRLPWAQRYIETSKQALLWLNKPRKSPFFAWVHYNNAHQPYRAIGAPTDLFIKDKFYDPSKRIRVNSKPLSLPIPKNHPYAWEILRPDIGGVHPTAALKENPNELAYYIARYDAGIYAVDLLAGDLLQQIRKMGLLENTIVAVVGDHGEGLGHHNYFFGHGRLPYQDCANVPFMIRPVGGVDSIRVTEPVGIFALPPTLLEMAGIKAPKEMEATSLLPIADGKEKGGYVFMQSGYQLDFTLSVWDGKWKLIHIPNKIDRSLMTGSEYELYNLQDDPREQNNLYASEPQVAGKLKKVLKDWSQPWIETAYGPAGITGVQVDKKTLEQLRSLGYLK